MHRKEVLGVALMCLLAWPPLAQSDTGNNNPVAMKVNAQIGPLSAAETRRLQQRQVMHEYMAAFNSRDPARWADTLLFPHVRVGRGGVAVHPARDEFVAQMDFAAFAQQVIGGAARGTIWSGSSRRWRGPCCGAIHHYDPQQQPTASFLAVCLTTERFRRLGNSRALEFCT